MSEDNNDAKAWLNHILAELKRFDKSHDHIAAKLEKVDERLENYNGSLLRNTITLEEHVRRTNLLEDKMQDIDGEVRGLHDHIKSLSWFTRFLKFFSSEQFLNILKISLILSSLAAAYHFGNFSFLKHVLE